MIRIEHSVHINRPRHEVFDLLTDIDRLPEWQSGVTEASRLTEGPVRIGYQYQQMAKVGPWKMLISSAVTDMKANERFAFTAKSDGPVDYEGMFELQPVAGGTKLSISCSARLKGVWRLLQPMLAGDLRKETRQELESVKRLIEQEAPVGASMLGSRS
jgi:carbon monoxide dehydrogenase subunit G